MSSFGFLNVSGIDGVGSGSSGGGFPGGIDQSVQFNDGGLAFGGVSTFLYDKVAATLSVDKTKPNQIIDGSNSVGTAGQVLSSTGGGLQYITPTPPTAPGAPVNSVQFNSAGAFGGDSNFIFDSATDILNVNGNVGIGSLSTPTDRLVVTGANSTIRVKSTTTNNANLVLEDSSVGVKQLALSVNTDTADFLSIQQGPVFRNFRFNPTNNTSSISVGTTSAQAIGGLMCSQVLSNRKIILFTVANDDHQNYSLGVNSNLFRFQLPSTTPRYGWFAATGSGASNELMSLTGTGQLTVGQSATSLVTISKLGVLTGTQGYLKLGGNETGLLSNRLIGFGYNFSNNNQPAYIGYQERSNTNQTNGDLIFGTRNVTTNTVPTERMRILTTGNVGIGTSTPATALEVNGTTTMTSLKTTTILDNTNAVGTAGQFLSSTGTALSWINNPVPIRYTAQFSADVVVPIAIGTSAVILRTATFATGLDFPVPPPIFSIEVLQTGDYQCSYHIDFENTGGGVGTFTTALRRSSAPALTLQEQRISVTNGEIGQLSDTFFVSMIAGELWELSLSNTTTCSYKNVRLVFQTI
jgi:hypothetical protein